MLDHWNEFRLPLDDNSYIAELFHENSKVGRHDQARSQPAVARRMRRMHNCLPYHGLPELEIPAAPALSKRLDECIVERASCHDMAPTTFGLVELSALLFYSYGVTRENLDSDWPRPFRVVPSGGALYPLELLFFAKHVEGLEKGLYHYNAAHHKVRVLRVDDLSHDIENALVPFQSHLAYQASVIFFVTALFERSIFKYGARGYRFALLEAGHVAQNLNLTSVALKLGNLNVGGYFDRDIDNLLGIDGVTHSTVYIIAVGQDSTRNLCQ